ncbi:MAG: BMC domain-containing protein [Bacillota bacterium]
MAKTALGMVETLGLNAAFEAADVAKKAANVKLIGYEISRGGLILVKFTGDVGAVQAAVDAAKQAASKLSKVVGAHVIPRPNKEIDDMIFTDETVGYKKEKVSEDSSTDKEQTPEETKSDSEKSESGNIETEKDKEESDDDEEDEEAEDDDEDDDEDDIKDNKEKEDEAKNSENDDEIKAEDSSDKKENGADEAAVPEKDEEDICNICGDPACPRKKGDLRKNCIHYDEIIGDDN